MSVIDLDLWDQGLINQVRVIFEDTKTVDFSDPVAVTEAVGSLRGAVLIALRVLGQENAPTDSPF